MNKEGTIYTIIFIFLVSVVFVFLLSLTNVATIEQVELNQEVATQGAVLSAMGIEATSPEEIQEKFSAVATDREAGLFVSEVGDEMVFAKQFAGPGLWGTIEGIIAVTSDLSRIVGIEIVNDNETPGLGGRINEGWFKEQFRGERLGEAIRVEARPGDGDPDRTNSLVDGVTGATRTSDAMEAIVNREVGILGTDELQRALRSLESEGGRS